MEIDKTKYSRFLENVAADLDVPPGKYQDAVDRYQAVGGWLEGGRYPDWTGVPSIYPQGSFRLGTVVRPLRDGIEADYDIDLVCELPIAKHRTDARAVKTMAGERLREHHRYRKLLEREGKRCWTLKYAERDGIGFHLDVLPAVPDPGLPLDSSIAITNSQSGVYDWSASNPQGYGRWFDAKNRAAFELVLMEQRRSIQARAATVYASVDDVPDQLVRTTLQRSVQIMKRHRDVMFNDAKSNGHAPISIIITTLAAEMYRGERDLHSALTGIVSKLSGFAGLVDRRFAVPSGALAGLIRRTPDGKWCIANPVNPEENFADRWHEDDHARARAFFHWVAALKENFIDVHHVRRVTEARQRFSAALGASVVTSHLGLIAPAEAAVSSFPKIRISRPAKPWLSGE